MNPQNFRYTQAPNQKDFIQKTAVENSEPEKRHTFFDFPAELRNMIYFHLLKASYKAAYPLLPSKIIRSIL